MATKSKGGVATPAAPAAPSAPVLGGNTLAGQQARQSYQQSTAARQQVNPAARSKGGTAVPASGAAAVIPVAGGVQAVNPLDPRDATYWAEKARHEFDVSQGKARLQGESEIDQRNYGEALRQLAQQQPLQEQSAKESYNKAGLFYSGKLGEALNTLATSFAQRRGQAQTELADRERARAAARAALDQGYSIDDAAALAASVDRQIGRDTEAADSGALTVTDSLQAQPGYAGTPLAAPKASAPATRPKVVVKSGWVWHYYPDGRKVKVRQAN